MKVQVLVTGVSVVIVAQLWRDKSGQACSVRRKYGEVRRTTVAELVVLEMSVKMGAAGVGRLPPTPLNVTPAENDIALPSIVLLVSITTA